MASADLVVIDGALQARAFVLTQSLDGLVIEGFEDFVTFEREVIERADQIRW